jgi:hypothetical protein
MKEYKTPDFEMIEYDVEDCLTGSKEIPKETESLDDILNGII